MKRSALIGFFATAAIAVASAAAAAEPQGVEVPTQRNGSVVCGYVGNRWIPGSVVEGDLFLSHSAKLNAWKRSVKKLSGRKRAALQNKIDALSKRIARDSKKCSNRDGKLRFQAAGAVAFAVRKGASSSGVSALSTDYGTLVTVLPNGSLLPAFTGGNPQVVDIFPAPDGRVVIVFKDKQNLPGGGSNCIMAVAGTDGSLACVENEGWGIQTDAEIFHYNDLVQFDSQGAIYYFTKFGGGSEGYESYRRWKDGVRTTIVERTGWPMNSVVMPDGTVYLALQSSVERFNPDGSNQQIASTTGSMGNILSLDGAGNLFLSVAGLHRYSLQTGTLETRTWIGSANNGANPIYNIDSLCNTSPRPTFCDSAGSSVTNAGLTDNGKLFGLAGLWGTGTLIEISPEFVVPTTVVTQAARLIVVGNSVVVAGFDNENMNRLAVHDAVTGVESEIEAGRDLEVYHLQRLADGKVIFDALRFSDNKYVVGTLDPLTGTLSAAPTGSGKLVSLRTLALQH